MVEGVGVGVFNLTDLAYLGELNELAYLTELSTPGDKQNLKIFLPFPITLWDN